MKPLEILMELGPTYRLAANDLKQRREQMKTWRINRLTSGVHYVRNGGGIAKLPNPIWTLKQARDFVDWLGRS